MEFKIDENLPVGLIEELRVAGFEAATVAEQQLVGGSDLALSCRSEGRILVTMDPDFADIRTYPPETIPA